MGMLYEYSFEEREALGYLTEEELSLKERMRDKYAERQLPDYDKLRELEGQ